MKFPMVLLTLALLAGCASGDPPGAAYVAADRATYKAVWPRLKAYKDKDESLEQWQKDNIEDTGKSWNARISEAEKVVAPVTTATGGK